MKFTTAVVLAAVVTPACSLSAYLQQLSSPSTGAGISDAPFFFTNGAQDQPAQPLSNDSFYSAPSDVPSSKNTADYMSALSSSATAGAPTGAGLGSYLDALKAPASSTTGSGLSGYLDALPKSQAPSGGGMPSYAQSLNQAAAAAAPAQSQPAPASPVDNSFSAPNSAVAASTSGYLSHLAGASSLSGGPGMRGYLDAIPTAPAARGGAGIPTYKDALASNTAVGGGAGIRSHADALSPVGTSGKSTYSPSGTSYNTPSGASSSFAMGSVSGRFDFSLQASGEIIEQIRAAGDRRVTLSGTIDDVYYN